jgi:hypothetical protein
MQDPAGQHASDKGTGAARVRQLTVDRGGLQGQYPGKAEHV